MYLWMIFKFLIPVLGHPALTYLYYGIFRLTGGDPISKKDQSKLAWSSRGILFFAIATLAFSLINIASAGIEEYGLLFGISVFLFLFILFIHYALVLRFFINAVKPEETPKELALGSSLGSAIISGSVGFVTQFLLK